MTWTIMIARVLSGTLYLDPGSGSFLLQLLIAGIAGGALAIKIYWKRISAFFNKKDPSQPAEVTEEGKAPTDEQ